MTEVNDKGISADLVRNLDDEDKEVATDEMAGRDPRDDIKVAVTDTVESTRSGDKWEGITQVIQRAPLDTRKDTVAEAVISASPENKKDVARQAMDSLPYTARQELARQLAPSLEMTDQVWLIVVRTFQWVLWSATLALVVAIGVALFREVDLAYVLIPFATVLALVIASILTASMSGRHPGKITTPLRDRDKKSGSDDKGNESGVKNGESEQKGNN